MTELTKDTFETVVRGASGAVLVDFWAPWCGPCKMLGPIIEQLAGTMGDRLPIAKINIDDEPELAGEFSVMTIPTLIVFRDGKEVARQSGMQPLPQLLKWLEPHV